MILKTGHTDPHIYAEIPVDQPYAHLITPFFEIIPNARAARSTPTKCRYFGADPHY